MKGFILAVVAGAIAFVLMLQILPDSMIAFSGGTQQLILLALFVRGRERAHQADREAPVVPDLVPDPGAVRASSSTPRSCWASRTWPRTSRSWTSPSAAGRRRGLTADTIVGAVVASIVLSRHHDGRRARRPATDRGARRDGSPRRRSSAPPGGSARPLYVTSVAALAAAAARAARRRSRTPGCARSRSRPTTCRRSSRGSPPLGLDANVVSLGRVGRRAGGGAAERPDHPRGHRQVQPRTCGRRSAPRPQAIRCAGWPSRAPRSSTRWWRMAGRAGLGPRRGGAARSTCCCASTRTSQPETHAGLAVGRGSSKFGMTETELTAARRRRSPAAGPLRGARHPPPRRVAAGGGRRLAGRGATRRSRCWRCCGAGCAGFDTLDVGGGFPVGDPGTVPTPARFAARAAGPARGDPRRTGGPRGWRWSPDGSSSPGGLDRRVGAARPRAWRRRAGRGAGRRDDRAHPADAVRGGAPGRGADVAGRAGRRR